MTRIHVEYSVSPAVSNDELNALFTDAWRITQINRDYSTVLTQSLGYICAYLGDQLVGFVNVAGDGAAHAFLLDPTVRSDLQRQGIGSELVRRAIELAKSKSAEWLHVDYETHLVKFYEKCGFNSTHAGLINLKE